MIVQNWNCEANYSFSESLSKADAFASKKRVEAKRIATSPTWSLWPIAFAVKAIRNERVRLLPLAVIMMHSFDANPKGVSSSESKVFNFNFSVKALWWGYRNRRLNSEWLVEAILKEFELLNPIVSEIIKDVWWCLIHNWHNFIKQALSEVWQLGKIHY